MELFTKLFGDLLAFVYHCFDRIVIHGYVTRLCRPEHVVYFFREVVGVPVITKEILRQRTDAYQSWVEAFARNHKIPIQWPEKGTRKEDYVLRWLRRMERRNGYGVYFIFKSMEVGSTFPFKTTYYLNGHSFIEHQLNQANIGFRKNDNAFLAVDDVAALQAAADMLSPEIIRKRLDYWTFILGPKFSAKERRQVKLSRTYAISQVEYCFNYIFKRNFPIHKLFERSCELGLWRLTAHKIAEVFGTRLHRNQRGKLSTIIHQIEHGHHVFRVYFKNAILRQYEKFLIFLRNELCSNNLYDFRLRKGLEHLDEVRHKFQTIISRFAGFQAQWLNVHADFPLLQRIALPTTVGASRCPGIKIHDTRVIRLLEVLLHGATQVGGWTAREIHQAVLTTFGLSESAYGLNQLRYDLRKLKGHGLLERDGARYAYRLTLKGVQVALLFLFFHKRLCGPLANSRFHHRPDPHHRPDSRLEAAYHRADNAIQRIVEMIAAA